MEETQLKKRKNILFLSSSYVNLAKLFAENNPDTDVFLIIDRKFPFEIEDLDNFYTYSFDKEKLFYKKRSAYFDSLGIFSSNFSPDVVVCNNFTKLLPKEFLEFYSFTSPKTKIINIHHADLKVIENGDMKYKGLQADIKEMLCDEKIISTIHLIEDEKMDTGKILEQSYETTLKELKQKGYLHKPEEMINLRLRNVVLSYHERTKVLNLLKKVVDDLTQ